jgi:hypothetical protein
VFLLFLSVMVAGLALSSLEGGCICNLLSIYLSIYIYIFFMSAIVTGLALSSLDGGSTFYLCIIYLSISLYISSSCQ